MGGVVMPPLPPMSSEEVPNSRVPSLHGRYPLPRYSGPVRHPLAVGRFPGTPGYTPDLAPLISPRDEEGFSSFSMRLRHRAVAPSSAGARRPFSHVGSPHVACVVFRSARPPGFGSFGASSRSLALRPGDSLTIPLMALSIGFRVSVSLHPAIQATGRLALAPAGLAPASRTCLSLDTGSPDLTAAGSPAGS